MTTRTLLLSSLVLFFISSSAFAEDSAPPAAGDEKVDVETIKQKYWAKGKESELGVVQNRLYTKAKKWNLGVFGGVISSDPFLSVKNAGGFLGYNFSEYVAVNVVYWKHFVNPSSALQTFEGTLGATTNNNPPSHFFGLEGVFSLIYGKISFLGEKIIYYDLHMIGGLGRTTTRNGDYLTPYAGIGQNIYFSKVTSLQVDYRIQYYKEDIIERVRPSTIGQKLGSRSNWTNVVTVGFSFLIGKDQE